jgi:Mg2+/Co2+ transporter CorB
MENIYNAVAVFVQESGQEPLCFLLQLAAVAACAILCVRCFRHWRVWVPLSGVCLLVLLYAELITTCFLVPFVAALAKVVIWLCVCFLILALPILLILRWIATGIISYFQRLTHRCKDCVYSRNGTCAQPTPCKGQ